MRTAVPAWCAVPSLAIVPAVPRAARPAQGTGQGRRETGTARVPATFQARGVPGADMAGMVGSLDVSRHGAGGARHRPTPPRGRFHGGAAGMAAPGCTAA